MVSEVLSDEARARLADFRRAKLSDLESRFAAAATNAPTRAAHGGQCVEIGQHVRLIALLA